MSESRGRLRFVSYDAEGRIDQDFACLKCGYNLRTQRDDGDCPECGDSVYDSARCAWLCQHDPAWLHRLAGATAWITTAFVCFALLLLTSLIGVAFQGFYGGTIVLAVSIALGAAAGAFGFWQITAPHRCAGIRRGRLRPVARWLVLTGLAGFMLAILVGAVLGEVELGEWLFRCSLVCLASGAWATFTYVAALVAMMPEARPVKHMRFVTWGFVLCFLLTLVMTLSPSELLGVLILSGLLILNIWAVPLVIGYRRRFREALTISQQGDDSQVPECGHGAAQEGRLRQRDRKWRRIVIGVALVLLSVYPLVVVGGWWREQSAMREHGITGFVQGTTGSAPAQLYQQKVGPEWLIKRLPDALGRFFNRGIALYADDRAQLGACRALRHVGVVMANGEAVTDADLANLKGLSKLHHLHLTDARVTDAGLVHLERLTKLGNLVLRNTSVTDAGLAHLSGLTKLTHLDIAHTQVTDAGLVHLQGLAELESLLLDGTQVTDAGLVHLKGLAGLGMLWLDGTQVTDAGLVHLQGLPRLMTLRLDGTQVTDAGLVHLKGLTGLRTLSLNGAQVTDASLVHLKGLTGLWTLNLSNTRVTDAVVAKVKQALPHVEVTLE